MLALGFPRDSVILPHQSCGFVTSMNFAAELTPRSCIVEPGDSSLRA
jgi:hypothetical protein